MHHQKNGEHTKQGEQRDDQEEIMKRFYRSQQGVFIEEKDNVVVADKQMIIR